MDISVIISLIAILVGLGFIIIRAFGGHRPLMNCLLAVVLICVVSGLNVGDGIATSFAGGFANMMRNMALFFCACTAFGKAMQAAGYANSIAYFISDRVNARLAPTIIFAVTVILALGGMLIAPAIIVYPIAMMLLSKANYSKRILPGACLSGFWTVTCCSPFIPSAANNILIGLLGTGPDAGRTIGLAATAFLFVGIILYMQWQVNSWWKKGIVLEEHDEVPPDDPESRKGLPSFWESLIPIIVVLALYNVFKVPTAVSMMAATVVIAVLRLRTLGLSQWMDVLENGLYEGISAPPTPFA